jgi:1,4-dihydroxy-2-naphthoate octaprenyltransferase
MKNEKLTSAASPSAPKAYLLAARPKTWIASCSPVLLGTAFVPHIQWQIFFLTLLFSLLIQIGTNYANDYFDFINGADSKLRIGPKRATQEGWIAAQSMFLATLTAFVCAILIAIPLMLIAGLWSLFLAAACIAFGILYTGGPKPLGYLGLGEALVFLFFGPIATCGTTFLQTGSVTLPVFIASLAPGFLSCTILIANNLRDEKSDRATNKRTLIVRFGRTFGCWEYTLSVFLACLIPLILVLAFGLPVSLALTSLTFVAAIPLIKKVFQFRDPLELISVLQGSASLLFLYTILFCLTLFLGNPT